MTTYCMTTVACVVTGTATTEWQPRVTATGHSYVLATLFSTLTRPCRAMIQTRQNLIETLLPCQAYDKHLHPQQEQVKQGLACKPFCSSRTSWMCAFGTSSLTNDNTYVCVYVCMCMCVYIYTYVYVHTVIHPYAFVRMYVCIYIYVRMYVCTYVCMYVYVAADTCFHDRTL